MVAMIRERWTAREGDFKGLVVLTGSHLCSSWPAKDPDPALPNCDITLAGDFDSGKSRSAHACPVGFLDSS